MKKFNNLLIYKDLILKILTEYFKLILEQFERIGVLLSGILATILGTLNTNIEAQLKEDGHRILIVDIYGRNDFDLTR
jgi:hypothetical protein